ncbi:glycosyltransferase family 8 protein [Salinimicrobium sp. TH3]|uniref:glycosyltransferase family 8 protein n=1 Tax=Salinimicrobium sp. TH3 TaxID=2997342 RepID=UPI0022764BAC|nr:glycosyltransferase family 8 protein [Salinimicrobium sp. TH3]MCY2687793.1 glycosyltransferase family 8 protein [Salinimicrobium sp. TH3]
MVKAVNIAYSFDDNYAKYAGISLFSLLVNNQKIERLKIFIIGENISLENIEKLKEVAIKFNREITFIDIFDIIPKMDVIPSFGISAYGRLFLSNYLDIDKVYYFDSDTIINDSIHEIINIDLGEALVAGIQDSVNPYYLHEIGLETSEKYINSGGVLILNLALWRKMGIEQKCLDFLKKFNGNPPHNDQGTINNICKGYIKILHPKFNLMNPMLLFNAKQIKDLFKIQEYYSQIQLKEAVNNPVVIHFTTEFFDRPWFHNCTHPLKNIFLGYMKSSPWNLKLEKNKLSKNCRIQNWIYDNCPLKIYKLMIRYIEIKHRFITN